MMTGERILSLFSALLLQLLGLGLLLFWAMGAVMLVTQDGGQPAFLTLAGLERTFYWLYPVFLLVFSAVGWLLFWGRRDLLANATLSAPLGLMAAFYLYLVLF
jgi:hypothetical protein